MKYLMFALLAIACLACENEGEKEVLRMQRNLEIRDAKYQKLRENYQIRRGDYDNLREAHNVAIDAGNTDSLHLEINKQHDMLEQNHEAYFVKHDKLLKQHEGLKERFEVEGYALEDIRADMQEMNDNFDKMEREFGYINAEITQMIEEQQGMLSTH